MPSAREPLRIQVWLSRRGIASRRAVEKLITEGKIKINGKPAKLGQKIDPAKDKVEIQGRWIPPTSKPAKTTIYAVFKPRGVVTTLKDPEGRPTIRDLVPSQPRVFPVGRLDIMSEGLILMTNDGELAQKLMHPKFGVSKTYEVKIRGDLNERKIQALKRGVRSGSDKFKGAEVLSVKEVTQKGFKKFVVQLKVFEGKNHLVRRMFDALKCHVIRLKRVAMGPVELKRIPRGGFRPLTTKEVRELYDSVQSESA